MASSGYDGDGSDSFPVYTVVENPDGQTLPNPQNHGQTLPNGYTRGLERRPSRVERGLCKIEFDDHVRMAPLSPRRCPVHQCSSQSGQQQQQQYWSPMCTPRIIKTGHEHQMKHAMIGQWVDGVNDQCLPAMPAERQQSRSVQDPSVDTIEVIDTSVIDTGRGGAKVVRWDSKKDEEKVSCLSWRCFCSSGKNDKKKDKKKDERSSPPSSRGESPSSKGESPQNKGDFPMSRMECPPSKPDSPPNKFSTPATNSTGMSSNSADMHRTLPCNGEHGNHWPEGTMMEHGTSYHRYWMPTPPHSTMSCHPDMYGYEQKKVSPTHHNYVQLEFPRHHHLPQPLPHPHPHQHAASVPEEWSEYLIGGREGYASSVEGTSPPGFRNKNGTHNNLVGKCILKIGQKCHPSMREAGNFSNPVSLDVFPNGDIAVLDSENYTLQLFTQKGTCKKVYKFQRQIQDLVVLDHCSVGLLREKDIGVFNINEHSVQNVTLLDCCKPQAISKVQYSRYETNFVVAMSNYVMIYKGDGQIACKIQNHQQNKKDGDIQYHLVRITDVTVHQRHRDIFVLDSGSRSVYVFSHKGQYKQTIDTTKFQVGAMSAFGKLCVDSVGSLVLSDTKHHRVLHYQRGTARCLLQYLRDYYPNAVMVTEDNRLIVALNSEGRTFAGVRVYNYRHR